MATQTTNEQIPLVVNRADDGSGGWSLHLDLEGHENDDFLCSGQAHWIADKKFKQIRGIGRWSRPNKRDMVTARRVARERRSGRAGEG
jgi:hypothetical protein